MHGVLVGYKSRNMRYVCVINLEECKYGFLWIYDKAKQLQHPLQSFKKPNDYTNTATNMLTNILNAKGPHWLIPRISKERQRFVENKIVIF